VTEIKWSRSRFKSSDQEMTGKIAETVLKIEVGYDYIWLDKSVSIHGNSFESPNSVGDELE
jgi:hypothetical protein